MIKRFCYALVGVVVMAAIGMLARQVSVMVWRAMTHEEPPTQNI